MAGLDRSAKPMIEDPEIRINTSQSRENRSVFNKHLALFLSAVKYLLRNPVRSSIIIICLIALLAPFVTAIAICEGIKFQYARILKDGGDVYVTRDNYGSNAPIGLEMIDRFKEIPGVTKVVPRVIGRTYVQEKLMIILGIPSASIPSSIRIIQGTAPAAKGEVIIGQRAADYLKLTIGSRFSIRRNPVQVFKIVGIFHSSFNIWNADLLLMNFTDAAELFGISNKATDLLIYTRPGYEKIVDIIIRISEQESEQPPLRVQTRKLIHRYSQRGFNIQAGVFAAFYSIVFALAIPCLGVISGFGMSERKREIGVMKALGWQTPEILEMVALENLVLSLISVPLIPVVAAGWIYLFNGAGIVRYFMPAYDILISFSIPSRIFPIPFVVGIMMAIILTMVASIYPTWRTAIIPPFEAMKT